MVLGMKDDLKFNVDKRTSRKENAEDFQAGIWQYRQSLRKRQIQGASAPLKLPTGAMPFKVFARKRPIFDHELAKGEYDTVTCEDQQCVTVHKCNMKPDLKHMYISHKSHYLHGVFSERASNRDVFEHVAGPLLDAACSGHTGAFCSGLFLVLFFFLPRVGPSCSPLHHLCIFPFQRFYSPSNILTPPLRKHRNQPLIVFCAGHGHEGDSSYGPLLGGQVVLAVPALPSHHCNFMYTATLLMYGQTGSGKTHTINGVLEFAAEELFRRSPRGAQISLSSLELCGNQCFDLLNDRQPLHLREDSSGLVNVAGLVHSPVRSGGTTLCST